MINLNPQEVTFIVPSNDGESKKIIEICNSLGLYVKVSKQGWGATLDKEPPETFLNLKKNIVVIEMPSPEKEKELQNKGNNVYLIDHHIYKYGNKTLDRSNKKSSLEQFADLIGYSLKIDRDSIDERGIALNDRGYIWLLREEKYSDEEIKKIRMYDLEAQGYTDEEFKIATEDHEQGELMTKEQIFIVRTKMTKTSYIADLHQIKSGSKNDLLVLHNGDGVTAEVNFYGNPDRCKRLFSRFSGWIGGDEKFSMFWGCKENVPEQDDLIKFIDSEIIFYSTFFYFPFKIEKSCDIKDEMSLEEMQGFKWKESSFELWDGKDETKDEKSGEHKKSLNNQELLYFHHYMRKIGYNLSADKEEDKFLKYFCIHKEGNPVNFDSDKFIIKADDIGIDKGFYLSDLALYIFKDSKIGILSIGVKNDGCTLEAAMHFNKNFRLLYITDTEQLHDGNCRIFKKIKIQGMPLQNEFSEDKHFVTNKKANYLPTNINSIVGNLIPFRYIAEYTPILDDRMVLHTLFCINENKGEYYKYSDRYRQLFSRILFVDSYDNGYAYNECFMKDLLKKHIYTRWAHLDTLNGFCRYADATVLFGRSFIKNNFRFNYYMMSIIALYYRCALIDFAARSSDVTKKLTSFWLFRYFKPNGANKLRKDFLTFSNIWYFRELTNQDQGIEMFDMHRSAYGLDELYRQVKEEIEKLDEYIRMNRATRLNWLIIILTFVALITGFFGMNFAFKWFKLLTGQPITP